MIFIVNCLKIIYIFYKILANLRTHVFISSLLSTHQHHDDYDYYHHECTRREKRLAFWLIWLNRACVDLTSKRARRDIYRKKNERKNENRSAICQHQSSLVVVYLSLYKADGRTKFKFVSQPIIYNQGGGNGFYTTWHLSFCLTYTNIQLVVIHLIPFFHSFMLDITVPMVSTEQ
jgi:hypothetical protein